jgi:hypothetical protein
MISDFIQKTNASLESRGLPTNSYFEVEFYDGSIITEKECNWSSFSYPTVIDNCGAKMLLHVATLPIDKITIYLNDLKTSIDVPPGYDCYQFIKAERLLATGIDRHTCLGRGIGLVKNGKVVEEKFINAIENKVMGIRS